MADIVQHRQDKLLIRKIGYSVGLEDTLKKLFDLSNLLNENQEVSNHHFENLVTNKNGWNRSHSSVKHLLNIFSSLNFLNVSNGRYIIGDILEASTLLRKNIPDNEDYLESIKPIFLYSILLSDGELFLNLLKINFDKNKVKNQLSLFREKKITLFNKYYQMINDQNYLHNTIDFKEISILQGKKEINVKNKKLGPLGNQKKPEISQNISNFDINLSDDWYTKILPSRKRWAISLGLYKDNEVTDEGLRLLKNINNLMPKELRKNNNSYSILPTDFEILRQTSNHNFPKEFEIKFFDLIDAINKTYIKDDRPTLINLPLTGNKLIKQMSDLEKQYRNLDKKFTSIKQDLPLMILGLYFLGESVLKNSLLDNLEIFKNELLENKNELLLRKSKQHLWSIKLKLKLK